MNYRHAFHAGNHTEVFKHAALTFVLQSLTKKPRPFAVLDTHAGLGVYDLTAEPAQRTGEYAEGVARVAGRPLASAPAYAELIAGMNAEDLTTYPGSPEIIRRFLRDGDRLMACELHPVDVETLRTRYRGDRRVSVHHRDGYEAIRGLLPPPERRGLVFIDPPFEKTDEAETLAAALATGLGRWPNGIFMAWFPVKDARIRDTLSRAAAAQAMPKTLLAEFAPYAADEASLPGSGLMVINTPWKLDEQLTALSQELAGLLGAGKARWKIDWLTAP